MSRWIRELKAEETATELFNAAAVIAIVVTKISIAAAETYNIAAIMLIAVAVTSISATEICKTVFSISIAPAGISIIAALIFDGVLFLIGPAESLGISQQNKRFCKKQKTLSFTYKVLYVYAFLA